MPTRVNKSTYGTTTAGVFAFTDSDKEDDFIIDKKIWESEMTTALKAHSKFIDNGEAVFLAIKGQTEPTVWDKMCADAAFAAIQDEKCPVCAPVHLAFINATNFTGHFSS